MFELLLVFLIKQQKVISILLGVGKSKIKFLNFQLLYFSDLEKLRFTHDVQRISKLTTHYPQGCAKYRHISKVK